MSTRKCTTAASVTGTLHRRCSVRALPRRTTQLRDAGPCPAIDTAGWPVTCRLRAAHRPLRHSSQAGAVSRFDSGAGPGSHAVMPGVSPPRAPAVSEVRNTSPVAPSTLRAPSSRPRRYADLATTATRGLRASTRTVHPLGVDAAAGCSTLPASLANFCSRFRSRTMALDEASAGFIHCTATCTTAQWRFSCTTR